MKEMTKEQRREFYNKILEYKDANNIDRFSSLPDYNIATLMHRAAERAREEEREACAEEALRAARHQAHRKSWPWHSFSKSMMTSQDLYSHGESVSLHIAENIRLRSEEPSEPEPDESPAISTICPKCHNKARRTPCSECGHDLTQQAIDEALQRAVDKERGAKPDPLKQAVTFEDMTKVIKGWVNGETLSDAAARIAKQKAGK